MTRRLISSGSTFEEQIGYSRAVVDGDWIFVSGTTGFDYGSMTISDNLAEQTEQFRNASERVLALAQERKMAVLVNVPFGGRGQGAASMFGRVKGKALPDWAAEFDATSWAQVFLKYVVSHPAVTAAIPGTTQRRNMEDNQGAGKGRLPDAAMRQRIEQYWDSLA